jgi:hypothetical protein
MIGCDDDKYGAGCQQRCGWCLNSEQCHHINGACLNGCNPGYQGLNCKGIEHLIIFFLSEAGPSDECLNKKKYSTPADILRTIIHGINYEH